MSTYREYAMQVEEKPNFKLNNTTIYYLNNCYCLPFSVTHEQGPIAVRITGACFGNGNVFLYRGELWFAYGNDEGGFLGTYEKLGA